MNRARAASALGLVGLMTFVGAPLGSADPGAFSPPALSWGCDTNAWDLVDLCGDIWENGGSSLRICSTDQATKTMRCSISIIYSYTANGALPGAVHGRVVAESPGEYSEYEAAPCAFLPLLGCSMQNILSGMHVLFVPCGSTETVYLLLDLYAETGLTQAHHEAVTPVTVTNSASCTVA